MRVAVFLVCALCKYHENAPCCQEVIAQWARARPTKANVAGEEKEKKGGKEEGEVSRRACFRFLFPSS